MRELIEAIPDAEALLSLEPEELGAKLLFLLRRAQAQRNMKLHIQNVTGGDLFHSHVGARTYPMEKAEEIRNAILEAWQWLTQLLALSSMTPN